MIRLDVQQGSPDWEICRIGIPTASGFDRIITPAKLKLSTKRHDYRNELLAEWLLGYKLDFGNKSAFVERGREMEEEARSFYELTYDVDAVPGGVILRDDGKVGGSPDALVGDDGGAEFKCPAIHTHIGYMVDPKSLVAEYHGQVQGYLYLTGRDYWDLLSYNPVLPPVMERVEPDPFYLAALELALSAFTEELDSLKVQLAQHRAQSNLDITLQRVMAQAQRIVRPAREWLPKSSAEKPKYTEALL